MFMGNNALWLGDFAAYVLPNIVSMIASGISFFIFISIVSFSAKLLALFKAAVIVFHNAFVVNSRGRALRRMLSEQCLLRLQGPICRFGMYIPYQFLHLIFPFWVV
jgi:hypothetical protein